MNKDISSLAAPHTDFAGHGVTYFPLLLGLDECQRVASERYSI